jgi:hypothetical protein
VQLATFGRTLAGRPDALSGYGLSVLTVHDPGVIAASGESQHPVISSTGNEEDVVQGTVFEVTSEELARADAYEGENYRRIGVVLLSGIRAWVYAQA